MAENDIYKNKEKYETFISNLDRLLEKPKAQSKTRYYCKNHKNLKYFERLIKHFEVKDLSYICRLRVFGVLKVICTVIDKDLKECERKDIDDLVAFAHTRYNTRESKRDFIKDLKCVWRVLFPEKDHLGRIDETLTPYVVRHISRKIDKSKEKMRNDRFSFEEFKQIVDYFEKDARLQAYLTLAFESLGRPQELLYTKVKDYHFYDNYARVWISEHGIFTDDTKVFDLLGVRQISMESVWQAKLRDKR